MRILFFFKKEVDDKLSVCSKCDICLLGFAAQCNVMCDRLRSWRTGSGAYRKEDIALLVLALSAPT